MQNFKASIRAAGGKPISRVACLSVLLLCACVIVPTARAQHHLPMDTTALVNGASTIFIGEVVSAEPRWNDFHNLIYTDYRFRVERVFLGDAGSGADLVLTQAGGTLDGVTDELSSNPQVEVGARYLVFRHPEAGMVFSDFLGGGQGLQRIEPDGLARRGDGEATPLDELVAELERAVEARAGAPAVIRHAGPREGVIYPAKESVRMRTPVGRDRSGRHGFSPVAEPVEEGFPARVPVSQVAWVGEPEPDEPAVRAGEPMPVPEWSYGSVAVRPIVWDEWPHDWYWSPHDQYMMSRWNTVIAGLHHVSGTDLGTWSYGNERFELVGWPDDEAMLRQFGQVWGDDVLAYTFRSTLNGVVIEADIAMNPAYCWTLDLYRGLDPGDDCFEIEQTLLHELGHGWGLNHPWENHNVTWDSVMNYAPKAYRFPWLHVDDALAARDAYPVGTALRDALISPYNTADAAGTNHAGYFSAFSTGGTIRHGESLPIHGLRVENVGTINMPIPQVDIWLTEAWRSWSASYVFLRSATFTRPLEAAASRNLLPGTTTIPATVPTGLYYPTVWLVPVGDEPTGNNIASSTPGQRVRISNQRVHLTATTNWQTWSLGRIGPDGTWEFQLDNTIPGSVYELSLCAALGNGWADFDTWISGPGAASNDDYCGLASYLQFVASRTAERFEVSGYNEQAQGNFRLAYRVTYGDLIFRNGFEY